MNINYFNIIEQLSSWTPEDLNKLSDDIEKLAYIKEQIELREKVSKMFNPLS